MKSLRSKKSEAAATGTQLHGKSFAFTGRLRHSDDVHAFIQAEGGKALDKLTEKATHLIVGQKRAALTEDEKKAAKLNQRGAAIQVLAEEDFFKLLALSREEGLAILKAGPAARKRWDDRYRHWPARELVPIPDLSKCNLRGADLSELRLKAVNLDGADLREANLYKAELKSSDDPEGDHAFRKAQFDGARLEEASIGGLVNCSLRHACLRSAGVYALDGSDLTSADLSGFNASSAVGAVFRNAVLERAFLRLADLKKADLRGAKLSEATLEEATLREAKLAGAVLRNTFLKGADLRKADLTGADLRKANLVGADLRGAGIDRADFTDAYLPGAKLAGLDLARAVGLQEAVQPPTARPGPCARHLFSKMKELNADTVSISLEMLEPRRVVQVSVRAGSWGTEAAAVEELPWRGGARWHHEYKAKSPEKALLQIAHHWRGGRLLPDTVKITSWNNEPLGAEAQALAMAAWYEPFGQPLPEETDQNARRDGARAELVALLHKGPDGVAAWNQLGVDLLREAGHFHLDLAGLDLSGLMMHSLDFSGTRFDGSKLTGSSGGADGEIRLCLRDASFRNADLNDAWKYMIGVDCRGANFEGATFSNTFVCDGDFRGASFRRAQFAKACLQSSDLRGVDFTDADLNDTHFHFSKFDATTKFPKGFRIPDNMKWKGTGPRPGVPRLKKSAAPLDFDAFVKRLAGYTETPRRVNALKMLKADRFQLFADVADAALTGVVKSQTDKKLVYACRLTAAGAFCCGTQNLKPCGGLQGALCKHLLVLIVGLTKAGRLDPTRAALWIEASLSHKPALDKDAMSETFLRYKGAEAGDVDWRPTETIPEDYYAL